MADTTFIYELIDPRTGQTRYVGKTDRPDRRLDQHLIDNHNQFKQRWIQELAQLSLRPKLTILDEVPSNQWVEHERQWIQRKKDSGCDLLNIRDGGPCKIESWNRLRMVISIMPADLRAMFMKKGLGDNNRAVAKSLGISAYTLNQFYQKRDVSPMTVAKIATAVGAKPSDIAIEVTN